MKTQDGSFAKPGQGPCVKHVIVKGSINSEAMNM